MLLKTSKIVNKGAFFLFSVFWEDRHLELLEKASEIAAHQHAAAIICYIQEAMEDGYPITVVVSQKLADSEFGLVVDTTGSGFDLDDFEDKINPDKKRVLN